MRYFIRHLCHFLLTLLFLIIFFTPPVFAQDFVRLGKVGEWNNNYGEFNAVDVKEIDGNTYAFCATSRGVVVFRRHFEKVEQDRIKAEISFISFVPLGDCTDIVIQESGEFEKDFYAYITVSDKGLYIRNFTNPAFSYHVGTCNTFGIAEGVTISGDYAFLTNEVYGLRVIDISHPNVPYIVGTWDTPGNLEGVAISESGDYAFLADGNRGLQVINIINKIEPIIVGSCNITDGAKGVAIFEKYAFVLYYSGFFKDYEEGLRIIDIGDPNAPSIVGTCITPGDAHGVAISESGDYAFVADGYSGLQIIDISSNPNKPSIVGSRDTPGYANSVAISGDYAFVVWSGDENNGLQVIDISNPNAPSIVGSWDPHPDDALGVAVYGGYAYVLNGVSGLQIIDISKKDGPIIVSTCDTPDYAREVAISGNYAFVVFSPEGPPKGGLQIIDISDPNAPSIIGSCNTADYAYGVAISKLGDYAFVANAGSGLKIIDISSDPNKPSIVGSCDTPGYAYGVTISESGDYAFVADGYSGLQIIDISSNPNKPSIVGSRDTPGYANSVVISGDYAFVVWSGDENNGLQVIDISNPNAPSIVGTCYIPSTAEGIAIFGDYAFVATGHSGLQIIDISSKKDPNIVYSYNTLGYARGVAISGDHAFVVNSSKEQGYENGLLKLKINIDPPPEGKGNLILVAGGNINYKSFNQQKINTIIRKKETTLDFPDNRISYWQITQALANYVFNTFQNSGYEVYDIYYFNPEPLQDTDNNGSFNQLVVDADPNPDPKEVWDTNSTQPTKHVYKVREELTKIIRQFPEDHLANNGPLYIYLLGHAAENHFLISSNVVISAKELRDAINKFRNGYTDNEGTYHPGTNRQVVVIIESAASGTFIDNLINDPNSDNITVITSTGDGASYIKPVFTNPNTAYNSFTSAFINTNAFLAAITPNLDPNNIPDDIPSIINDYLTEAFTTARNQLESCALKGTPFADQAPQMASSGDIFSSLSFSKDRVTPLEDLFIDQNIPYTLTIIGQDPNNTYIPLSNDSIPHTMTFFSSDTNILDPLEDIQTTTDPNGILWYTLTPNKNGRCTLIAHIDSPSYPHLLLSSKLTIEVAVDDPGFFRDKDKMAIIAAGYKGTGDYLFDSTNTIANHAYKTFRAMGYTKEEIFYYNPYFLQDLDEDEEFDEIDGYPKLSIFDSNAAPDTFPLAELNLSDCKVGELFLFLVDHGGKDSFCINPTESLTSVYLIDQIEAIAEKVDEKIIFLYDACHSGSFLSEIKKREAENPNYTLIKKLITITSTDPNQTAYYLNKGIISFAYPFFDEWFLTHSLTAALDYAEGSILGDQTPQISDPDLAAQWDQNSIYFVDESRPFIDEVQAHRSNGTLHISAYVFSLTGIDQVWAVVEGPQKTVTSIYGQAITDALEFSLSSDPNDGFSNSDPFGGYYQLSPPAPDPCPNETNYLITIYAKDKSKRPKTAFYKTAIGNPIQNKTKALIIASDPTLFQGYEYEQDEELKAQVSRAEAILKYKGLKTEDNFEHGDLITIRGENISSLDELPDISSLTKDQTLFIYLIGIVELRGDNTPFKLNKNLALDPNEFCAYMPQDPNQRLLILMDTPYADRFLEKIDPDNKHKNWARIASTDQEQLFFLIKDEKKEKLFPCFSSFFFRMVLSGATVAQTFRMAKNAVSITRQGPDLFIPEDIQNYQTIARHLNYHLGWFQGKDFSLFLDCEVQADANYTLSFTTPPEANISRAWAVLTASPAAAVHQEFYIVDFNLNEAVQGASETLYQAEIYSGQKYYKAYFNVEGQMEGDDADKNIPEWKEAPIIHTRGEDKIKDDGFETGEDPNNPSAILSDPNRKIFANAPPTRRTFYCEDCEPGGIFTDYDWMYFYAHEGHIYDIYAQDLSAKYFIQIALYDPNMQLIPQDPNKPDGPFLIDKDFLTFMCKESGYYLIETRLASSYPAEGVEYILSVTDPQAEEYTPSQVWVIDTCEPQRNNLSVRISRPDGNSISYDNIYEVDYPNNKWIFSFNDSKPWEEFTIEVYQEVDKEEEIIAFSPMVIDKSNLPSTLNIRTIDLSSVPCDFGLSPPKLPYNMWRTDTDLNCTDWVTSWRSVIGTPNPFHEGDKDPNFPLMGDYDGDGIINIREYYLDTSPINPTIILSLYKGENLFYFPAIAGIGIPHTVPINVLKKPYHFRDHNKGTWNEFGTTKSHKFNALDASSGGLLYLDVEDFTLPVLCLRGFSCTNDSELFDPNEFSQNELTVSIKKVLNNLEQVEAISCQNKRADRMYSTYRFFGKIAGDDSDVKPDNVYIIYKKR